MSAPGLAMDAASVLPLALSKQYRWSEVMAQGFDGLSTHELRVLLPSLEAELEDVEQLSKGMIGGTGIHVGSRMMRRARYLHEEKGAELRRRIEEVRRVLAARDLALDREEGTVTSLNNVNVNVLAQVTKEARADRSKAKRTQRIEGQWLLEAGAPQFQAEITFEGGKVVLQSDQPRNLGGGGTRLGPMHYCFFGLLSCYTSIFAAVASEMDITLERLTARVEGDLNFSRVFGLSQEPVMEEVRLSLQVKADASREKLEEVERLAYERCPAVYALTQPVKLKTTMEVQQ